MAHSPASGEYLSARLAARENDIDKAGAAFGRLAGAFADDPVLVRQAMFYRLASGDIPSALAYAEYILEQNATPQIAAPDDDAAGEEGDLPVAEPSDDQQSDALAHLVVAAGANVHLKFCKAFSDIFLTKTTTSKHLKTVTSTSGPTRGPSK